MTDIPAEAGKTIDRLPLSKWEIFFLKVAVRLVVLALFGILMAACGFVWTQVLNMNTMGRDFADMKTSVTQQITELRGDFDSHAAAIAKGFEAALDNHKKSADADKGEITAEFDVIKEELAELKAYVNSEHGGTQHASGGDFPPIPVLPGEGVQRMAQQPLASELLEQREQIQKRVDTAVYRKRAASKE